MNFCRFFPLLLALLLADVAIGQVNDFQIWSSLEGSVELSEKVKVAVATEMRFRENAGIAGTSQSDIGIEYSPKKAWSIAAFYRYSIDDPFLDCAAYGHRAFLDISKKQNWNRYKFSLRLRLSADNESGSFSDAGATEGVHREKFSVSYNIKGSPLTPSFSAECFFPLDKSFVLDKIRISPELSYKFGDIHKLSLGYMLQRRLTDVPKENDWVLVIGYSVSIK